MPELPLNEASLLPRQDPELAIELGTVGWFGDDDHADLGTEDNDGTSLVKVTLYRGQQPYDQMEPGQARGHRVLARVMGPAFYVPPVGTEVVVAFPGGFGLTPGAAIILGTLGRTPSIQFGKQKAKLDVGPDQDLVLKGRSVTMAMYNPENPNLVEDFLSISPEGGIQAVDRKGFGFVIKDESVVIFAPDPDDGDAKTIVRLTKSELMLANKDAGGNQCCIVLKDQEVCMAGLVVNSCTPGANLGAASSAMTPVIVGAGGVAAWTAWLAALAAMSPPVPPPPCAPSATINAQP